MSCAEIFQLGGEAHDVDQGRTQIVADDIGEALDLVVGFRQVGGAVLDDTFEVLVGGGKLQLRGLRVGGSCVG